MAEPDKDADGAQEMRRVSGQFMGHGLTLALAVLFFMGVGWWLDSKLGSAPFLTIIGAFVGGGAGFYSLYYHILIEPQLGKDDPQ